MQKARVERRLAAILAADVVGYSRLIGQDEADTLARLKAIRRDIVDPQVQAHSGRIVKTTGDGILIEFPSAVAAVECAVAVQSAMAERARSEPPERRIEFRVGVHQGDIVVEGGDLFGDGVNVAARLEGIAEPGGICISARVQEDAAGKLDLDLENLGEQTLKNIARQVRVYRVRIKGTSGAPASPHPSLTLPDKPSIAVLPFANMSGDPEQEYFADGVVEDIITALSHVRWLFVIARNSSFTYKGRAVDVKQVGRELGVRYVLEGSIRKAGNRVRITGQLINAETGAHVWAERYDRDLTDIFELQDEITHSVVGAIEPSLLQAEIARSKHKPTESLDAYDYYLRGLAGVHHGTRESTSEALRHFYRAIELDNEFSSAFGMAALCYDLRKWNGWTIDRAHEIAETERLARRAAELGKDDAVALCTGGFALAHVVGDLDEGASHIERALALNSNLAMAWHVSGWVAAYRGEPDIAIEHVLHAMRLSPLDPLSFLAQGAIGFAHFVAGRYEEASSWAQRSVREQPAFVPMVRLLAASSAMAGRLDEARKAMARVRELDPAFRISDVRATTPLRQPEDFARYVEGLRRAGLPE